MAFTFKDEWKFLVEWGTEKFTKKLFDNLGKQGD